MPYTDELFPTTAYEAGRVVLPFSRLVCDVERFPSDEDEPMASRGMGVFYTRTSTAACFGRNRVLQSGSRSWIAGTGRIIRSWSAW
jgi:hypothetical protein